MKRFLLSVITVTSAVGLSTMAMPSTDKKLGTLINPDGLSKEVLSTEYYSESIRPYEADSKDSLQLTVKWVLKAETSEKDAFGCFYLIDEGGRTTIIQNTDALVKNSKDKTFTIKVPTGKYDALLQFNTTIPAASDIIKVVIKEDVMLTKDETLTFDGNTATKRINYTIKLPDGELATLPDYITSSNYNWDKATIGYLELSSYIGCDKFPLLAFGRIYYCYFNRSTTGTDRTQSADIFVNEGVSNSYYQAVFGRMFYKDPTETRGRDFNKRSMAFTLGGRLDGSKLANVIDPSLYIPYTPAPRDTTLFNGKKPTATGFKYDYIWEPVMRSNRFTGMTTYAPTKGEAINLLLNTTGADFCKYTFRTMNLEFTNTALLSVADGIGITSPTVNLKNDGTAEYVMSDVKAEGMSDINLERFPDMNGFFMYERIPGHEYYSYNDKEQDVRFGGSTPILSYPMIEATGTTIKTINPRMTGPQFMGIFGERRSVDVLASTWISMADNDTLTTTYNNLALSFINHAKTDHEKPHRIKIQVDDQNFMIDTIKGRLFVEMQYTEGAEDVSCPTMMMYQIRNKAGKITNKIKEEGAVLAFSGNDYQYDKYGFTTEKCDIKLEMAIHGSNNFKEIQTTEVEKYNHPMWGTFRQVVLDKELGFNHTGWFDIRFSLTDKAGNTQVQTLTPAFYAEFATSGINNPSSDGLNVRIEDATILTDSEDAIIEVWNTVGVKVVSVKGNSASILDLNSGLYILKVSTKDSVKVMKIVR